MKHETSNERGGVIDKREAGAGKGTRTHLSWAVTLLLLPPMMCTLLRGQPLSGRLNGNPCWCCPRSCLLKALDGHATLDGGWLVVRHCYQPALRGGGALSIKHGNVTHIHTYGNTKISTIAQYSTYYSIWKILY
jgi:hypothetical protein